MEAKEFREEIVHSVEFRGRLVQVKEPIAGSQRAYRCSTPGYTVV